MKELLGKLSSYNLFNYLLPGTVFVVLLREITSYDLVQESVFLGAFLYYFIGLCISRFGSLIVGFILKKITFIKFTDYSDYIHASDSDEKIQLFSEVNNVYRTLIAMFSLLLLTKAFESICANWNCDKQTTITLLIIVLLILFIFSYKKQTGFIVSRVNVRNKKSA
ncbi:MAG: hypothetical protein AAGA77_10400 [Bacteroidota bacterium]